MTQALYAHMNNKIKKYERQKKKKPERSLERWDTVCARVTPSQLPADVAGHKCLYYNSPQS
jgi:hypothetical protein